MVAVLLRMPVFVEHYTGGPEPVGALRNSLTDDRLKGIRRRVINEAIDWRRLKRRLTPPRKDLREVRRGNVAW